MCFFFLKTAIKLLELKYSEVIKTNNLLNNFMYLFFAWHIMERLLRH